MPSLFILKNDFCVNLFIASEKAAVHATLRQMFETARYQREAGKSAIGLNVTDF